MGRHSWLAMCLAVVAACSIYEDPTVPLHNASKVDDDLVRPKSGGTTVYLVRHAEKESIQGESDPPLSITGRSRADDLSIRLSGAPLSGAIATTFQRTIKTAEPAASANSINVTSFPPGDTTQMADHIMQNWAGGNAVVVGHTSTVGEIAVALGVPGPVWSIPSYDYDNLYIVQIPPGQTVTPGASTLIQQRYGAATPSPDATSQTLSESVNEGQEKHYGPYTIEMGSDFVARLNGSGDGDVYIRYGAQPTRQQWDCRPYLEDSDETCDVIAPIGETQIYVMVRGCRAATYDLDITHVPDDGGGGGDGGDGGGGGGGGGGPTTESFSGSVSTNQSRFYGPFTVEPGTNFTAHTTGTGDPDLFVRFGAQPTEELWDCESSGSDATETCTLTVPANQTQAYVEVYGYDSGTYDLDVTYVPDSGAPPPSSSGPVTETFSDSVARDDKRRYGPFAVAPGTTFTAQLTGTGDADLHVRFGEEPTLQRWDCRPYREDSNETCDIQVPAGQTQAHVMVDGYRSATYDLTVTYQP